VSNRKARFKVIVPVCASLLSLSLLMPQSYAAVAPAAAAMASDSASTVGNSAPSLDGEVIDESEAKISKEAAVARLKELFPVFKDAEAERIVFGNAYGDPSRFEPVWEISWSFKQGNTHYGFNSSVDAMTGDILQVYLPHHRETGEETSYYPAKVSEAEAKASAEAFIRKAAPSVKFDQLKFNKNNFNHFGMEMRLFGPVQYHFSYEMTHNGLVIPNGYIQVTVDGNGNVTRFSKPYIHANEYPDTKTAITKADALKQFKNNVNLELRYVRSFGYRTKPEWSLVWADSSTYGMIDAKTGKFIGHDGTESANFQVTTEEVTAMSPSFKPAAPANGQLTAKQAAAIVQSEFKLPAGRKLQNYHITSDYSNPESKVWRLEWADTTKSDPMMHHYQQRTIASIDAKTGRIIEYRRDGYDYYPMEKDTAAETVNNPIGVDAAKTAALKLVNKLYPNAAQSLKLITSDRDHKSAEAEPQNHRFSFQRYVNGIAVEGENVYITLDAEGSLLSYESYRMEDIEETLNKMKAEVTEQTAKDLYLNSMDTELRYAQIGGYHIDDKYVKPVIKLIYSKELHVKDMEYAHGINAVTGKWYQGWGDDTRKRQQQTAKDIAGHAAEKDLEVMLKYGILSPDENGNVKPDEAITVADWYAMFAKAMEPNYEQYGMYTEMTAIGDIAKEDPLLPLASFIVGNGWAKPAEITKSMLTSPLTREKLAVITVDLLNYERISQFLQSPLPYSDQADIQDKGAVLIAGSIGLFELNSGKFEPKSDITRAKASQALMKIVYLQGKTDQPIGRYY